MEEEISDIKEAMGELRGTVGAMKDELKRLREERKDDNMALRAELDKGNTAMRVELGALVASVNAMQQTISTAKGGWRTLLIVSGALGTAIATVVALLTEAIHWLRDLH